MTKVRIHTLAVVIKWVTIIFAWCAWISAVYVGNIFLFILGFIPYLVIYNCIIKSMINSMPEGLAENNCDTTNKPPKN